MKGIILSLFCTLSVTAFAQAPKLIHVRTVLTLDRSETYHIYTVNVPAAKKGDTVIINPNYVQWEIVSIQGKLMLSAPRVSASGVVSFALIRTAQTETPVHIDGQEFTVTVIQDN